MKNADYWKIRFGVLEEASNKYGLETYMQIEPAFDSAQREIQKEIEAWYGRYARNNGITMQEARRQLSTKELKEFRWDVKEYIKYGQQNALNQQWIKELENASARVHVSRLEALKIRTQQAAEVAFGNELDCIDAMARKVFTEDYYHSIFEMQKGFGIGWEIGQIDQKKLDKFVKKPWALDGKHFSERIWQQRWQLVSEIHQQLTRTCILGKAPDDAIKAISKKFGTTKSNAGRLVMTEQAYFHSVAQQEAFNDLDVEEFEIVATLDAETSEICQEMDGKHFPMSTYEAGVTAPPFHPWCRSVTVPYFEDNYTGKRAARNADGETYYVPDNMTYPEWKKGMVDGETEALTKTPSYDIRTSDDSVDDSSIKVGADVNSKIQDQIAKVLGVESSAIRIGELPIESQQIVLDAVQNTFAKFPMLKGHTKTILYDDSIDSIANSSSIAGIVRIGSDFLDTDKLQKSHAYSAKLGFHPKGTTDVRSLITHELGHQLDGLLTKKGAFGGSISMHGVVRTSCQVQKEVLAKLGLTDARLREIRKEYASKGYAGKDLTHAVRFEREEFIRKHISEYACYNEREFFAECFMEFMESENPREAAKIFGEILEEIVGGV